MKERKIFVEIVICVAVDRKSDSRQGKYKVFINFQDKKNLKLQWLRKIKPKNIQFIQHARMYNAYCLD